MYRPKLRMRYRMSVIYGHPVMAATRALRFSDHVTKRNGGSGDENGSTVASLLCAWANCHVTPTNSIVIETIESTDVGKGNDAIEV